MAPDHIYEIALLGVSRWQRQAMEKLMSINCTCPEHVDHFECLKPEKFGPFSRPLLSRGRKMWRKDVQDTIDSCKEAETPFDLYLMGYEEPHYPLPARIVTFDYWPAGETDSGRPTLYGHDHYKPGRWMEFMEVEL